MRKFLFSPVFLLSFIIQLFFASALFSSYVDKACCIHWICCWAAGVCACIRTLLSSRFFFQNISCPYPFPSNVPLCLVFVHTGCPCSRCGSFKDPYTYLDFRCPLNRLSLEQGEVERAGNSNMCLPPPTHYMFPRAISFCRVRRKTFLRQQN